MERYGKFCFFNCAKPVRLNSLQKQIPFTESLKAKAAIALILCAYLSFIVIVLQPFDTGQFQAQYKVVLLSGYGILTAAVFVLYGMAENVWYRRMGRFWRVLQEVVSTLLFCFCAGSVLYMYNRTVVNDGLPYTAFTYFRFLRVTVLCMIPVFVPPMVYLRQRFGEKITPPQPNSFTLTGENKHEILTLGKADVLFVKAVENYVEICFLAADKTPASKTFRQTLSNVGAQLPFLEKCHRSYLVNSDNIKEITGNSQAAKITFVSADKEIPLSKTYYKKFRVVDGVSQIAY